MSSLNITCGGVNSHTERDTASTTTSGEIGNPLPSCLRWVFPLLCTDSPKISRRLRRRNSKHLGGVPSISPDSSRSRRLTLNNMLTKESGSELGYNLVMISGENIYFHVGWIIFDFEWPGQCYLAGNGCTGCSEIKVRYFYGSLRFY